MQIGTDFHGVIVDPAPLMIRLAREVYGVTLKPEQCTTRKAYPVMGDHYHESTRRIEESPLLLEYDIQDCCEESLKRIRSLGHLVIIVSTLSKRGIPYAKTLLKRIGDPYDEWINSKGRAKHEIAKERGLNRLVDDDPIIVRKAIDTGINAVLFDRPCNRDADPAIPRVYGWKNLAEMICGLR